MSSSKYFVDFAFSRTLVSDNLSLALIPFEARHFLGTNLGTQKTVSGCANIKEAVGHYGFRLEIIIFDMTLKIKINPNGNNLFSYAKKY